MKLISKRKLSIQVIFFQDFLGTQVGWEFFLEFSGKNSSNLKILSSEI